MSAETQKSRSGKPESLPSDSRWRWPSAGGRLLSSWTSDGQGRRGSDFVAITLLVFCTRTQDSTLPAVFSTRRECQAWSSIYVFLPGQQSIMQERSMQWNEPGVYSFIQMPSCATGEFQSLQGRARRVAMLAPPTSCQDPFVDMYMSFHDLHRHVMCAAQS